MTNDDVLYLAQILKARSGLIVGPDKQYLLESRLGPVARAMGLTGIPALTQKMRAPGGEAAVRAVVEAMTTNESFFFRDKTPFDHFEKVMLPALAKARATKKQIRIWCAAASTGQEPYSLAMILKERAALWAGLRIEIVGTDISTEVLDRAKAGLYTQFEVQRGLPVAYLVKYFKKDGDAWAIDPAIRTMVSYRAFNLLDPFAALGAFDVIFCRNVLIYFDTATKQNILDRMSALLAPDGYLLLGAAETVLGVTTAFAPHETARGLYVKTGAAGAAPALAMPPQARATA